MEISIQSKTLHKIVVDGEALDPNKAADREKITDFLANPQVINDLVMKAHDREGRVMTLIEALSPQQQLRILTTDHTAGSLARTGSAKRVFAIIEKMPLDDQAIVLAAKGSVSMLSEYYAKEIVSLIETMSPAQQQAVMSVPYAIYGLSSPEAGQIHSVIMFLNKMPIEQQAEILAKPDVIWSMGWDGGSHAVIEMLKPMTSTQQIAALNASNAVNSLAHRGQASEVMELLKAMKPEEQVAVLSVDYAIQSLARNNVASTVVDVVKELGPGQQKKILESFGTQEALRNAGCGDQVESIKANYNFCQVWKYDPATLGELKLPGQQSIALTRDS